MIRQRPLARPASVGGHLLTLVIAILIILFILGDVIFMTIEGKIVSGYILLWFILSFKEHLYETNQSVQLDWRISNYVKIYFIMLLLMLFFLSVATVPEKSKTIIIGFIIALPVVGIPINILLLKIIAYLKRSVPDTTKYTLVAGVGDTAMSFQKQVNGHLGSNRQIKGYIKCKNEPCLVEEDKVVSDLSNIHEYLSQNPIDEIVIALPVKTSKKVRNIIEAADYHGVRVKYIPDFQNLFGSNYKMTKYGRVEAINVRQMPLDDTYALLIKNCFDKVFSFAVLVMLAPLFLLIAGLIKLESKGPVFYCPIRIGKSGRPFRVYKFRSMRENDSASNGELSTQKDDERITQLGRILRKYSLDELPQFLNVLLGDMSVVGPRPHRNFLNQQFQMSVDKYMIRHYFKPGITGWAQVNGWRGPTSTLEQKTMRTQHDLWYVENWTLWLDLRIIFMTVFGKKTHENAF